MEYMNVIVISMDRLPVSQFNYSHSYTVYIHYGIVIITILTFSALLQKSNKLTVQNVNTITLFKHIYYFFEF